MKQFSLSRNERIKSKKLFELLYAEGKIAHSAGRRMKGIYCVLPAGTPPGVSIAAAVSRRAGKAVWRVRMKRLIREAYRLQKQEITAFCKERGLALTIVFSVNRISSKDGIAYKLSDIFPEVGSVLQKVIHKLQ